MASHLRHKNDADAEKFLRFWQETASDFEGLSMFEIRNAGAAVRIDPFFWHQMQAFKRCYRMGRCRRMVYLKIEKKQFRSRKWAKIRNVSVWIGALYGFKGPGECASVAQSVSAFGC
uniref:ACPS domain-containing protein n=1 Tax=Steinernema glaseri TaxID=37863 RepID=A0A1I7Y2B2_9BILA